MSFYRFTVGEWEIDVGVAVEVRSAVEDTGKSKDYLVIYDGRIYAPEIHRQ